MYSKLTDGSFIIAGFVAQDSEMKQSQNGKTYTKWSVKVAEKPPEEQEKYGEAIWTYCIAWGGLAKYAGTIKKGDTVLCIGRINKNQHEGKTYKTLVCNYISIMPKFQDSQPMQNNQPVGNNYDYGELIMDDSEPF